MIDNIELVKPLLNFEKKGDFYMLYILKRKKDFPDEEKNNHQSVRTIKTYCIESVEYLEKRYDEIRTLSELFKARVYIHVQKQNHFDVGLNMMVELAERLKNGIYDQRNLFESVVGQLKTYEKRWVVDVDSNATTTIETIESIINYCEPEGNKIISKIPTKNGVHLITKPFNVNQFNQRFIVRTDLKPDIQKRNPTLLYYPNSLKK